jgi:thiamine-phosphate pyrophosphorylase
VNEHKLYLVAPARLRAGELAHLVPELADAGVDIFQLREKEMEAGDILRIAGPVVEACRAAGAPVVINDRVDVAVALQADGVHLGQKDLPPKIARSIMPTGLIGLSTHAPVEIDDAVARRESDYIAVGPVYDTPTKPDRPPVGTELITYAAGASESLPWFAIGGIDRRTLPEVVEAGARRAVVVRAITEARDPAKAAAELRGLLDGAGSAPR